MANEKEKNSDKMKNDKYTVHDIERAPAEDVTRISDEALLAILERGNFFGEMALVDGRPRSADAVAHEEGAELLTIADPILGGLLDIEKLSSPTLLKLLCSTVARRLRVLDEKLFGWYMLSGGGSTVVGQPPTS